ncbi:MAG: hypothetical protein G3M78_02655 [Candidatus Nitrohelix vancouverensis]|uniref:Uncharacterized protein n=1 Tax=Candidatus Nitrohelix vancouverensis TaxID=2705534 RepID=A0A7T0G2K2_9BACT|nr:MAG: hypothetical protein G3M78_02655 [Candidatus Nitrohelix vancouverensis]
MDIYDKWFEILSKRLELGQRFGLRMQMEGEGKFKDFQGEHEIPALKTFLDNARHEKIEDLIIRGADAQDSVISECV